MQFKPGVALFVMFVIVSTIAAALVYHLRPTDVATALQRGRYQFAVQKLEQARYDTGAQANTLVLNTLANLYYVGLGVQQSYTRSARLYSEAAFAGNVAAQVNMGHLYANGHGVNVNGEMAYAWFNLARNNGSKIAQLYMSELLSERKMRHHLVNKVRAEFATIKSFTPLH